MAGAPEDTPPSLLEAALLRVAAWLRGRRLAAERGEPLPRPLVGCMRPLLGFANLINLVGLILLATLIPWVGQRWWPVSLIIYLPPLIGLLPGLALLLPTAWWAPRWLAVNVAALILGFMALLQPSWSWPATPKPGDLVVVTNNFGQHNRQSLRPFLEIEQPDLILLQEAMGRGPAFANAYPGYFWRAHGEYVLLSRYPITAGGMVLGSAGQAARFVVDVEGRELAVYNVHLHSPRRELQAAAHPRLVWEMLTGQRGSQTRLHTYQERLARRRDAALHLREVLEAEPLPFLAGGDFNVPAGTWLYRQVSRNLTDAHTTAGRGLGYTFPGETSQWLALRQPWLRIDYLFTGPGLTPVDARTESGRRSQHRAVSARLRWD